jgi:DNA-binding transcriptional ArsR family regulator
MALKHILGEVPVIKILGFLLDHRGYDYPKVEIAEHADVGPTDMRKDFHCLIDCEMVVETRKIGGVQLYKLNEDDIIIDAMLNLVATIGHVSEKIDEEEISIPLIDLVVSA